MPRHVPSTLPDRTLALRADPYRFVGERCRAAGRDAVETRLMLRRAVVMTGPEAAAVFYDPARFVRAGASPEPLRATLFGKGAVQTLDGAAHAARKALFLALLGPEQVERLVAIVRTRLDRAARAWPRADAVPLHEAMQGVLTRSVCDWAGVPLPAEDLALRTVQLASLYDDAMSAHHLRARRNRREVEAWIASAIEAARAGHGAAEGTPLHAVAAHRDADGEPLPARVAAVETLNLLRPTVAVAVYATFAAHALHRLPAWRDALRAQPGLGDCFAKEVRRFYPFFPLVAARVREPFSWQGVAFRTGRLALFDLYGTNHDPRCWEAPERFRPERFLEGRPGPFEFVPQGGGDARTGHRCPGEGVAQEVTRAVLGWLVERIVYEVPEQDMSLDMTRLPAVPRSGFRIANLRLR
ncbi:MAG TPA: cytochrome P450 [Burkholderiaceae bacterium]|nr:cytochrome P450 [Burkholderiaceae bacterium]